MKQHTNGFATPPTSKQLTRPMDAAPSRASGPEFSGLDSHPCATQLRCGRNPDRLPRAGSNYSCEAGSSPPWPPQLLHVALWDEHFSGRSVYLQVSDVVHDSPTLDGKALGRDVVVVDLQQNDRISERPISHTPSRTGKQSTCHHSTSPCGWGGLPLPQPLIPHLSIHNPAREGTTKVRQHEKPATSFDTTSTQARSLS